ncbi:hypothetical protein [Novosphingobium sp. Rr 2-17]|uniref:hypothetical protein n=1 Tax=Novosphingobium sp. Rr 2-17 TaxID=555793 RepID=UPI001ED92839|nr:hypothetical protein [Novosphingobium sp. Rr 2-17]
MAAEVTNRRANPIFNIKPPGQDLWLTLNGRLVVRQSAFVVEQAHWKSPHQRSGMKPFVTGAMVHQLLMPRDGYES